MNASHKTWLSPLLALSYVAVSLTGILMLFHWKFPGMYQLHQWGGLLFVIAGGVHLFMNWRVFMAYFKNRKHAVAGLVAGAVAIALLMAVMPHKEHGGKGGGRGLGGQYRHRVHR